MSNPSIQFFNETHQQARASARRFVEREISPHIDDWEEAGEFPRELYRKAGDAGLLGVGYPEALGGSGEGDLFLKIAVSEELMAAGSGGLVAGLGSLDIALPPLIQWGPQAMKESVVPPVLRGEKIAALAITEPGGGSDVANLKTRAVREGDHYRVSGSKTFITSGQRADYYSVAVRTGEPGHGGVSMLLVERDTPGFTRGRNLKKTGWWASDTAELFFEDAMVPASHLIGQENGGFMVIMTNFLRERLMLCVMAYTTAQLALDMALAYAKERKAFGRPIAGFQVTRHKLVDMATQVELARQYSYRCAALMQAGKTPVKEVAMAKNFSAEVAESVTREAVQIFGGMGYMREARVERLARDARLLAIGGGTTEIMKELIAKQMGL
ncbi:MAG: acyl-CoA dehydrogenase family protein [Oleiphilaceae bacterium]|nr:acyl-CoA dehydrogenase family protein [Oleiphilaceae bacterium]